MADFSEFVQQAAQLSLILNGPSKIPESFLKTLWDASEGGDPSGRVDRSVNQLVAHLDQGTVPADDGSGGGGGAAKPPSPAKSQMSSIPSPIKPKDKKEKKSKSKEKKASKMPSHFEASPPTASMGSEGVFGADLGMAGMCGMMGSTQASMPPPQSGFGMPPSQQSGGWGTAPSSMQSPPPSMQVVAGTMRPRCSSRRHSSRRHSHFNSRHSHSAHPRRSRTRGAQCSSRMKTATPTATTIGGTHQIRAHQPGANGVAEEWVKLSKLRCQPADLVEAHLVEVGERFFQELSRVRSTFDHTLSFRGAHAAFV